MVVTGKLGAEFASHALLPAIVALLAITAGTLYQNRYCPALDWRTGSVAEFVPTALVTGLLALLTEQHKPSTGPVSGVCTGLPGAGAFDWRGESVELAHSPQQFRQHGQPVLPGAAVYGGGCVGLVWRNFFRAGAGGHGGDCGWGLFGAQVKMQPNW